MSLPKPATLAYSDRLSLPPPLPPLPLLLPQQDYNLIELTDAEYAFLQKTAVDPTVESVEWDGVETPRTVAEVSATQRHAPTGTCARFRRYHLVTAGTAPLSKFDTNCFEFCLATQPALACLAQ